MCDMRTVRAAGDLLICAPQVGRGSGRGMSRRDLDGADADISTPLKRAD